MQIKCSESESESVQGELNPSILSDVYRRGLILYNILIHTNTVCVQGKLNPSILCDVPL